MKDVLVSLETIKLAAEKGCKQLKTNWYYTVGGLSKLNFESNWEELEASGDLQSGCVPTVTQSLLAKWLRDNHLIFINIQKETIGSDEWVFCYRLEWLPKENWEDKRRSGGFKDKYSFQESPGGTYWGGWDSYEEALEEGLKEALKLVEYPKLDKS